jgi:3'-5' exoribonuclease
MLKNAGVLAPEYADIVWADLLYAGVLFHDIGKLWENDYSEKGFDLQPTGMGELLGHIPIGIEIANKLWLQVSEENKEIFQQTTPPSQQVREHLLHLIASHHGELQFGAVVTPKTPEAFLLHFIDNIDAKMEMLRLTYSEKEPVRPGFYEARRPLSGLMAKPLVTSLSASTLE